MNRFGIPLLVLLSLTGCKAKENTDKSSARASNQGSSDGCMINGTVLSIHPVTGPNDPSDPCSRVPCFATIRIDKMWMTGQSFAKPSGSEVTVYFVFSLSETTEELYPNMGTWYPGLKVNDRFKAFIESRLGLGTEISYVIYDYQITE